MKIDFESQIYALFNDSCKICFFWNITLFSKMMPNFWLYIWTSKKIKLSFTKYLSKIYWFTSSKLYHWGHDKLGQKQAKKNKQVIIQYSCQGSTSIGRVMYGINGFQNISQRNWSKEISVTVISFSLGFLTCFDHFLNTGSRYF